LQVLASDGSEAGSRDEEIGGELGGIAVANGTGSYVGSGGGKATLPREDRRRQGYREAAIALEDGRAIG
jgi:hypothetical protein